MLGPEKLPKVVSELGRWVGRARAMARQFREQLEEEVQLEEARRRPMTPPESEPPPPPTFSHAHPTDATGADPTHPSASSAAGPTATLTPSERAPEPAAPDTSADERRA
ncbi:MAG: hypothetical protein JOZ67_08675 [Gammaproteobacteria bacterium]|nr:hypothetical protein [Gammaproteobacteria bacterium]